jgi:hypothetical protein
MQYLTWYLSLSHSGWWWNLALNYITKLLFLLSLDVRSSNHISETVIGFLNLFTMTPYFMLRALLFESLPTDYSLIQYNVRVIINGLHYGLFVLSCNWPLFIKIRIISFHKANLEFTIIQFCIIKDSYVTDMQNSEVPVPLIYDAGIKNHIIHFRFNDDIKFVSAGHIDFYICHTCKYIYLWLHQKCTYNYYKIIL